MSSTPFRPFHPVHNPRFVWLIGSIREEFPDIPADDLPICIWDRQERQPVFTLHETYEQLICLETVTNGAPFESMATWLNSLSNRALESEGLPITRDPTVPPPPAP